MGPKESYSFPRLLVYVHHMTALNTLIVSQSDIETTIVALESYIEHCHSDFEEHLYALLDNPIDLLTITEASRYSKLHPVSLITAK